MTWMLAEVLVVVKQLSRDVQYIMGELAEVKSPPSGPPTSQEPFPIQLPITNEEDFNEAETLLKTEAVRQKMIACLAMVGGTNSTCMIRRMLAAALTNGLACKFSWAVASRKCDRRLTQQAFSDISKN